MSRVSGVGYPVKFEGTRNKWTGCHAGTNALFEQGSSEYVDVPMAEDSTHKVGTPDT